MVLVAKKPLTCTEVQELTDALVPIRQAISPNQNLWGHAAIANKGDAVLQILGLWFVGSPAPVPKAQKGLVLLFQTSSLNRWQMKPFRPPTRTPTKTQKTNRQFRTSPLSSTYLYEQHQHSRENANPVKESTSTTDAVRSGEANYIWPVPVNLFHQVQLLPWQRSMCQQSASTIRGEWNHNSL